MSYVEKNLLPGETILCTGRLHWIIYLKPMVLMAVGLIVLVLPAFLSGVPAHLWIWGAAAIVVGLLAALPAMLRSWSTELVVTSMRIVAKHGVISRHTMEMLHKRIESLSVQQSIPGRLLDYGTLLIHGTGGGREAIPNIAEPLKFRNAAMAAQSGV